MEGRGQTRRFLMKGARSGVRALVAAGILATLLAPAVVPRSVLAQGTTTKPPVQRGQEYYEQSRFDEAIGLLRDLVDRGALTGDDLVKAREILARSYVKKGYPVQGKEMFKAILRQDASYRPDPIKVPPDETAVFEQALKEFQSEQAQPPPSQTPAERESVKVAAPPSTKAAPTAVVTEQKGGGKSIFGQWWFWAGSAAVVGGIAAALGGHKEDHPTPPSPLGSPPPPPRP